MTVRTRLIVSLAGITLLLVLPSLYSLNRLAELSGIAQELRGRHASTLVSLGRLQTAIAELERFQRSYIATPAPELREGMSRSLDRARREVSALQQLDYRDAAADLVQRISELDTANARIEAFVEAGQVDQATSYYQDVRPLLRAAYESVVEAAGEVDRRSGDQVMTAHRISAAALRTTLISLAAALVLALVIGAWTTGALTTPLRQLRTAMATVAGGRFVAPPGLPYERRDEIGDLAISFRTMAQQLAELDRMKAEFVGIASHELKTPLNVIGGYIELAEEGLYGDLNEKQREVLAAIRNQAQVLAGLVQQLLDVSRIEAGGFRVEPAETRTLELFESVSRDFKPLAERHRVDFSVETDATLPETVVIDGRRVRNEVLGNLLSNAFKFTPEGGRIRVRGWREASTLMISVSDSGSGIPPEHLPRIFDKYYQVGDRARDIGSGLGLAIARDIVIAHGGAIDAESEPGRGTTFRIRLPLDAPPLEPAAAARAREVVTPPEDS